MSRWLTFASWFAAPLGMLVAYSVLAVTSDTDASGKAWLSIGFGFVLVIWFAVRLLVNQTAIPRAIAAGDAERLLAATAHRRDPVALVYRALASELSGDWAAALSAVGEARPAKNPPIEALAASIRVAALVETGDTAGARRAHDGELGPRLASLDLRLHPAPHIHGALARGRLLLAEGERAAAHRELQRVIDDIRAGSAIRERARQLKNRG